MPKHRVLSLKPHLRFDWRDQDGQDETQKPDHFASLGDSVTSSTRMRFSVQTASRSDPRKAWLLVLQNFHLPGSDDLSEDDRIGPTSLLPSKVSSTWVDPSILWHVAGVEQQVDIRDRDLSVLDPGHDQHRGSRLTENLLHLQRQGRKCLGQIRHRLHVFNHVKKCRHLVEE